MAVPSRPHRSRPRGLRPGLVALLAVALLVTLLPPSAAQEATVPIKLLATNDFHGRLEPPSGSDFGGAAYLSTHLQAIRDEHPNTLHVDAGDLVGATPVISNLFFDEPTIEAMNHIGLDVQTVGNHEFDRGQDEILRRAEGGCVGDDCGYRGYADKPAVVRGATWHLREERAGGAADQTFRYGRAGDIPLMCDWDGDGARTPGVVRGRTWYLRDAQGSGPADTTFNYGRAGDTPVCGDWDGNGSETPGVVRGSAWHLRNANGAGAADHSFTYGRSGDTPVVGDWNGDQSTTPGVVRGRTWLLRDSVSAGPADHALNYGLASDTPVAGDWNDDGSDGVGVRRGNRWLLRGTASPGPAELSFAFGAASDAPVVWGTPDFPFAGSEFTTLSTNVVVEDSGDTLLPPYEVFDFDGVSVGFLGVTTVNTPEVVHPSGIEGLRFLAEAEAVNDWVPVLKDDLGVDIVVVLMHEGGRQEGGPNECVNFTGAAADIIPEFSPDVDVVVSGHTHSSYVCDFEDGPLVTSAFEYGKMFTEIDLEFDPDSGEISRSAVNHDVTRDVTPDPAILALIERYDRLAGPLLQEVVGTSEVHIPRTTREAESAQGNLATDALVDQYEGVDFAFQNSGGLRDDLTVETDRDGALFNIRREYVLEVWPFGNIVALAEIDGPTLQAILDNGVREIGGGRFIQVAGLAIEYSIDDAVNPDDNNGFPRGVVETVEYLNHPTVADGTPVDLSAGASYTIAMNDFMALGGDGYPVIIDDVFSLADSLEVAIENYLLANSPVNPQVEGRIVELQAPAG